LERRGYGAGCGREAIGRVEAVEEGSKGDPHGKVSESHGAIKKWRGEKCESE